MTYSRCLPHAAIAPLVVAAATLITPNFAQAKEAVPSFTQVGEAQVYTAGGFIFETPLGFSDLKPIGEEGIGVLYPATAAKGSQQLLITLVELSADQLELLRMDDAQLLSYIRYLHFGINAPTRQYQQRRFQDQTLTGEVQITRNNHIMELYLVPLSDGSKLVVAFESDPELPLMLVENTIQSVSRSLREDPKTFKKRHKKR